MYSLRLHSMLMGEQGFKPRFSAPQCILNHYTYWQRQYLRIFNELTALGGTQFSPFSSSMTKSSCRFVNVAIYHSFPGFKMSMALLLIHVEPQGPTWSAPTSLLDLISYPPALHQCPLVTLNLICAWIARLVLVFCHSLCLELFWLLPVTQLSVQMSPSQRVFSWLPVRKDLLLSHIALLDFLPNTFFFFFFSVAKSCLSLCNPMGCSLPDSSIHGIFQTRILAWVAIFSFRESSWPRDPMLLFALEGGFFTTESPGKPYYAQTYFIHLMDYILIVYFIQSLSSGPGKVTNT